MTPDISSTTACIKEGNSENEKSLSLSTNTTKKELVNERNGLTKSDELKVEENRGSSGFFQSELKWLNIISITILHSLALYAFLTYPYMERKMTLFFMYIMATLSGFGVTGGAHRLWTHRAYKAKWPLRVILLFCYYSSGQNSLYDWVRDHRIHHKYSETDADPHNSNRGFFFSHVGWLMMKKHPEVIKRGQQMDMSDILADPIVAFGEKYFVPFKIMCSFIIPIFIPVYCWNEEWYYAILSEVIRYVLILNSTWSVNSAAHIWGYKPYDKRIAPTQNVFVSIAALGEGWHNYHHVFPWDYKAAELGNYKLNFTTSLIDMFAKIGWAYDLKQPSEALIKSVIEKRGDGSHPTEEPVPKSE